MSADAEVCVVGAGFSGLAAARALRQRGIALRVVDRQSGIGGLWQDADLSASPAYRALHTNSVCRCSAP